MKKNQTYFPVKPGPETKLSRVNGYSKMNSMVDVKNIRQMPVDPMLLQLREMETINAGLVDLLDQRAKELEEVIASTTKSVSVLGHDLKSPLCTVIAALEMLKQKLESDYPAGYKQYISAASDSANKTLTLLEKLLKWSVSKNNCSTFNPVKINLYEFLKDEFEKITIEISQKSIAVDYSVPPGLNISGDIQMVRSIFRNLISNAIKFTDHGGKIEVKARVTGQFVEIIVEDNGIGMSSDLQNNILKNEEGILKFPVSGGRINGIGLMLCKDFIESHGGILEITSEPGKGSKFKFSLERID
jgi:signal transduction histidine kinase